MPKCDFNKVALQLYWNHTLARVFSCKFAANFQTPFSRSTSGGLLLYFWSQSGLPKSSKYITNAWSHHQTQKHPSPLKRNLIKNGIWAKMQGLIAHGSLWSCHFYTNNYCTSLTIQHYEHVVYCLPDTAISAVKWKVAMITIFLSKLDHRQFSNYIYYVTTLVGGLVSVWMTNHVDLNISSFNHYCCCRVFLACGMGESPLTSRKFAHPPTWKNYPSTATKFLFPFTK